MHDISRVFADFCATSSFANLPNEVVQQAKKLILDEFSLMAAGTMAHAEDGPDILRYIRSLGGKRESTLLGSGTRVPCNHATFANTVVAASAGFDSVHKTTIIHLSPVLVPAILAVAERLRASGDQLIRAFVLGGEVMARVGLALGARGTYSRGFHPTSACGPIGCAVGAGILLELGADKLTEAIRIAAVHAGGSSVWAGPRLPATFGLQIGRAAEGGVLAANLAALGFDGTRQIFEDDRGFLAAYSEVPDPSRLIHGIGDDFEIMNIALKRFSASDPNKGAVEALLDIMEEHELQGDSIGAIEIRLPTTVIPLYGSPEFPQNRGGTRVNSRYVLAATAYFGHDMAYSLDFAGPKVRDDARVKNLFARIAVIGDLELDRYFPEKKICVLEVRTYDGRVLQKRNEAAPKGDPDNPLTWDDIATKVARLAGPVLGQQQASQLVDAVEQLDRVEDVSTLSRLLVPPSRKTR